MNKNFIRQIVVYCDTESEFVIDYNITDEMTSSKAFCFSEDTGFLIIKVNDETVKVFNKDKIININVSFFN